MMATTLPGPLKTRLQLFRSSSLLMNALYLMLSTFVVAALGFVFWVLIARTYDAATVGLATTLLSVSSLLSLLGLAGFDTTFVRFLPRSKRKNDYINSGLIVVTLISAGLAVCFAVALPKLSPSLSILSSPSSLISFVFFTAVTSLNVLTNAVFLAFKQARYIFIINTLLSVSKVGLPIVVAHGDAMTIFGLAGGAQLIGLVLSIVWMRRTCSYSFAPLLDIDALRVVKKYSFSVYASSILNLLPPTLLPLIVVYQLGPENAAYYYMAFTIASVLYTISYASMQSVFAEGSHDETAMRMHMLKATKFVAVLLLPAALLTALTSSFLLMLFGHEYARGASILLQLFAFSALPLSVYAAMGAIFKITKDLRGVVSINLVYALAILGFSYLLMPRLGLMAVGWGWLLGNVAACSIGVLFLIKYNKR